MQINSNGYTQANEKALQNATLHQNKNESNSTQDKTQVLSIEEQIDKSAVEVALSMNAQIVLLSLDTADKIKGNTDAQKAILDFLSGKSEDKEFNLSNIGYEGKPITELSTEEATELIGEEGFFGINQTSQRVADFVLNFSADDLEKLEKGREGIVQGFEDAKEMWGDDLPEISYKTQTRTLELIDAKIAELKNNDNEALEQKDV
ncbi:hypothetical protein N9W00_00300 [Arcobacteraceae bacterium]|nr:hypothetical protein [Arcobacteraceae bacterium]